MSSPRRPSTCDGVLRHRNRPAGPIRLPEEEVEAFLEEFNATYGPLGLEALPVAQPPEELPPEERARRPATPFG